MKDYFVTFRSVTYAQRGEAALRTKGIRCALMRTPRWMEEKGCGYCLRIRWYHGDHAIAALREKGIAYGKVYTLEEDGVPREYLP